MRQREHGDGVFGIMQRTVSASRSLAAVRPSPRWRHRWIAFLIMRRRIDIRHQEREEKGDQISQTRIATALAVSALKLLRMEVR